LQRNSALPWDAKPERADIVIMTGIVVSGLYALLLLPLVPSLVSSHPALLELLRGSTVAVVTMGALARTGHASLVVAVAAGIPSLIAFDWAFWWAGRRWGARAMQTLGGSHPKAVRRSLRVQRIMERYGPLAVVLAYVLPVPTALVDAAAGWSRMRLAVFMICDVLGALLWTSLLVTLGYSIGQPAVDVVHQISRYSLFATIAIVVFIVGRQAYFNRGANAPPAP
jgi:membrane protein DedA with SNARE-associated domain